MNLKKKIREFFTLDRNADGFTLIELIVTVAIVAILGGVGVPAYSGYIEKTNKNADISLASEVAHALTLGYYNGTFSGTGYVVLSTENAPDPSNEDVANALTAAFGAGWGSDDAMKLKHNGWTSEGNTAATAFKQGFMAMAVPNSSYLTGGTTSSLLKNVTDLTTAASNLLTDMDKTVKYSTIRGELFNNDAEAFKAACDKFGISVSEQNGQPVFGESVTDAQLSNLLVFGAAQQISDGETSAITDYVDTYAKYAAFANANPNNTELQKAYQNLNATLMVDNTGDNKVGSADVESAFSVFENAANSHGFDAYQTAQEEQGNPDKIAFQQIMGAVTDASKNVTPEEMSSADFFSTSNKVSDSFNNYISAAETILGMGDDENAIDKLSASIQDGSIAIIINPNGPKILYTCDLG